MASFASITVAYAPTLATIMETSERQSAKRGCKAVGRSRLLVRQNGFPPNSREQKRRLAVQSRWILLIGPQEYFFGSSPQRRKRIGSFENMGSIGKL